MKIQKSALILAFMTLFIILFVYLFKDADTENRIALDKGNEYSFLRAINGSPEFPLKSPIDIAIAKDGTVFIADTENHRIQVFDQYGNFINHFGEFGEADGQLNYPVSIALDNQNNVYIVDLLNQRIQVFDIDGNFKKHLLEHNSSVVFPTGLTIDSDDFIYVIDKFDQKIKKLNEDGDLVLSFGSLDGEKGHLNYPLSVAINSLGDIIVADTGNGRVQVFNNQGQPKFSFEGYFSAPSGIALGSNDRLFISDPMNGRVIVTSFWGELQETVGSMGVLSGELYFPEGLEVFENNLYIADKGNNRVVIYSKR